MTTEDTLTIRDQITRDRIQAMKDKAKNPSPSTELKLRVLRSLETAFTAQETASKSGRIELTDAQTLAVLRAQHKRRLDTAKEYESVDQRDRAEQEQAEAHIIDGYLPALLTEDQVRDIATTIIQEKGVEGPRGIGQVMGDPRIKDNPAIDKSAASRIIQSMLT